MKNPPRRYAILVKHPHTKKVFVLARRYSYLDAEDTCREYREFKPWIVDLWEDPPNRL